MKRALLHRAALWMLVVAACRPLCAMATDDKCGYRTAVSGTVFTVTISRSFDPQVKFELCVREAPAQNFVLVSSESHLGSKRWVVNKVPLNHSDYTELLRLYELALGYDVKDSLMGADGSDWCLETQRGGTYSKACFWTPSVNAQKRNLVGLLSLGQDLWRLSALSPSGLY